MSRERMIAQLRSGPNHNLFSFHMNTENIKITQDDLKKMLQCEVILWVVVKVLLCCVFSAPKTKIPITLLPVTFSSKEFV